MLKIALPLVLLAILAGGFFYFKSSLFQNQPKKYSGPVEKIRIGNVGEYTIFNLIAAEKGFFKDNGLDATITEFTSGPASLEGLFKGETDINIAADFVGVRNIFDHPELRILAQVNQHRVFQLAAKKDRIKVPADLKGKKIGVTKSSVEEYHLGNFLVANSLKLEDITMVNLTPPEMITQIQSGNIDALVVFDPNIYKLKKILGENFISWDVQSEESSNALVYTTQGFIDKNPDVVESYLSALVKAEKYYVSNQQYVKELVAKKLGYEMEYVEYSWPKFKHAISLNQGLLVNLEAKARWTIKNKLTDKSVVPNYGDFIYSDALRTVKAEGVVLYK